jgi:hypothetical protein
VFAGLDEIRQAIAASPRLRAGMVRMGQTELLPRSLLPELKAALAAHRAKDMAATQLAPLCYWTGGPLGDEFDVRHLALATQYTLEHPAASFEQAKEYARLHWGQEKGASTLLTSKQAARTIQLMRECPSRSLETAIAMARYDVPSELTEDIPAKRQQPNPTYPRETHVGPADHVVLGPNTQPSDAANDRAAAESRAKRMS